MKAYFHFVIYLVKKFEKVEAMPHMYVNVDVPPPPATTAVGICFLTDVEIYACASNSQKLLLELRSHLCY